MDKIVGYGVASLGVLIVLLGVTLDLLFGRPFVFGWGQLIIVLVGGLIVAAGVVLSRRGIDWRNLAVLAFGLLMGLILIEAALRIIAQQDVDGQITVMRLRLRPYHLPVAGAEAQLEAYAAASQPYVVYHPELGWAPAPNGASANGLYHVNSDTIRSQVEYEPEPAEDVLRILVFGDSFTYGDDVADDENWPYFTEQLLREAGVQAEVLNFGMSGYGMDQAYLRYQLMGRDFNPDIVVFGFRSENVNRNLNIVRLIYTDTSDLPFSKPRYVLRDGALELVNSPTVPPDEMVDLLQNFEHSPLADYEFFYDRQLFANHWWLQSRLVSLVISALDDTAQPYEEKPEVFDLSHEGAQVTLAIIDAFASDVEAQGAEFVILDLDGDGQQGPSRALRERLMEHYRYVDSTPAFIDSDGVLKKPTAHYRPSKNRAVAEILAAELLAMVGDAAAP